MDALEFDAVAYDFDGTIAKTNDIHSQARLEAFSLYGEEQGDERYGQIPHEIHAEAHYHGHHSIEIIAWVLYKAGITAEIDYLAAKPIRDIKTDLYWEMARQGLPAIPGALDFIYVAGMYWPDKQGIVTSAYIEHEIHPFFNRYGLGPDFPDSRIVTVDDFLNVDGSVDMTHQKPAPDPYNLIIERFEIEPARLLAFEDNSRGIQSAKASGSFVIGLATTHTRAEIAQFRPEATPHIIASGFDEVSEMLVGV